MNSPEVKAFIRKHSSLFWYISEEKKEDISREVLIEFVLNYGDMAMVKELFELIGLKQLSEIFFNSVNCSERRKSNYNELTINYFTLIFNEYTKKYTTQKSV